MNWAMSVALLLKLPAGNALMTSNGPASAEPRR
jgi:hypothetical protein